MEISVFWVNLLTWLKLNWTFILFVGLIAGAFIFFRSTPSRVDSLAQLNGLLATGQPTIIEFYSNF